MIWRVQVFEPFLFTVNLQSHICVIYDFSKWLSPLITSVQNHRRWPRFFIFYFLFSHIYKIKYATGCITTKNIEKLTISCHSIRFLWPWPSHTDAILRLWRLRRLKGWHSIWKYELFLKKWKVSDDYAMVQKYCWPRAGWAEPS